MTQDQLARACESSGLTPQELLAYNRERLRPTLDGLLKQLKFYGSDFIMESATHLSDDEQEFLRKACKADRKARKQKAKDKRGW